MFQIVYVSKNKQFASNMRNNLRRKQVRALIRNFTSIQTRKHHPHSLLISSPLEPIAR